VNWFKVCQDCKGAADERWNMSWDLLAFEAPLDFKSPRKEDIPEGWEPKPFGLRSEVEAKLRVLLPGIQFDIQGNKGTLWGRWSHEASSLEISLGEAEDITYLWIAARGDGKALNTIAQIIDAFGLRGVDLQRGEFFDTETARESFGQWRKAVDRFRNQNIKG
jgi:hypothetical protein